MRSATGTIARSGRVLGVDLGARRVGVAVCDGAQRVATPLRAIDRTGDPLAHRSALRRLVAEYEAVGVVVGLPRSLSGELGAAARAALTEVDSLRQAVAVPVDTTDERLTTVTASAGLRAAGTPGRRRRGVVDAAAAAVLLQGWIDGRRGGDGMDVGGGRSGG